MAAKIAGNYIAGRWQPPADVRAVMNPGDGQALALVGYGQATIRRWHI